LDGWALLTFDFVPSEAYTHLTIGNFRDDANTLYTANPTNSSAGAYYYIDSLAVTQNFIPQLSIQGLTKICKGEATNLTAINGDTYSWATSLQPLIILGTGPEITVNPTETTNYFVYSSNDTASFTLNVVPYPIVTLGNDTSLCPGQSLSFTLSQSGVTYSWEDGSTSAERIINETGTYWVQLDRNGCIKSDTINLQIFNLPKPVLGNDTSICAGDTLRLEIINPDALITWQDGSTGNSFDVYSEGSFVVKVERFQCSLSDTVSILIKPQPLVNLGNDTTLCDGQSLILSVEQENSSYTWQDGSALPDYTVNSSGTYFVEVTKQGCKKADTLYVSLLSTSLFTLGNDTSFCFGNSISLNAGTPGAIIIWQDGSTNATYLATESGTYSVSIDLANCSIRDTLKLEVLPLPVFSLGQDTSLCKGSPLDFNFTGKGDSFLWNDGSVSPINVLEDSGNSWLSITKAGCIYSDSLVVQVIDCPTSLMYPNVFSPNGDSYNEYFSPSVNQGITQLNMVIYNRWGNQVFSSTDLNTNWDGKDGGKNCPEGVYFWLVEFTDILGYRNNLKGSVTLIK